MAMFNLRQMLYICVDERQNEMNLYSLSFSLLLRAGSRHIPPTIPVFILLLAYTSKNFQCCTLTEVFRLTMLKRISVVFERSAHEIISSWKFLNFLLNWLTNQIFSIVYYVQKNPIEQKHQRWPSRVKGNGI